MLRELIAIEFCLKNWGQARSARELDLLLTIDLEDEVQDAIASYSQFAIAPQLLSVREACELEPLLNPDAISGAMTVKHGHVHPEMTANAYIQAFIRAGGVRQIEQVTGLILQNQQVRGITTNRQKYSSANVVVCAGAYSRALLKAAGMPVKLYFTHTELIEIPAVDLQMRWLRPPAQRFRGKLPPKSLLLLAASQVMPAKMKWFDLEAESSTSAKEQLWDKPECEMSPPIIDAGAIQFMDGSLRLGQLSRVISNSNALINAVASVSAIRASIGRHVSGGKLPSRKLACEYYQN